MTKPSSWNRAAWASLSGEGSMVGSGLISSRPAGAYPTLI